MNFKTAMEALEAGHKVTRKPWPNLYFNIDNGMVKCYQPRLNAYIYDEDIMISRGWIVDGMEGEHAFCDIIDHLRRGLRAHQEDWSENIYIYFDKDTGVLNQHVMLASSFVPHFLAFLAEDWMILE